MIRVGVILSLFFALCLCRSQYHVSTSEDTIEVWEDLSLLKNNPVWKEENPLEVVSFNENLYFQKNNHSLPSIEVVDEEISIYLPFYTIFTKQTEISLDVSSNEIDILMNQENIVKEGNITFAFERICESYFILSHSSSFPIWFCLSDLSSLTKRADPPCCNINIPGDITYNTDCICTEGALQATSGTNIYIMGAATISGPGVFLDAIERISVDGSSIIRLLDGFFSTFGADLIMITTKSVIEGETVNSDFQFNASSGFVINDCTITAGDVTIMSTSTSLIAVEASSSTFNIEFSLNVSGDSTNAIGILWQENTISYGLDCTTNFQGNGMGAGLVIEQNTGTTIFQLVTFSGSLASNSPSNIAGLYITGTSNFKFNRNTVFYALAATDDDVPAILVDSHIVFAGLMDVEGDSPFGTGIIFNQIVEINNVGTVVGYGSCLGIAFFDDLTILTPNTVTIEGRISYDNLLSCENGFHAGIYFDNNFITSSGSPLALTGIVDPFFLVDNSYGIYFNNAQMTVDSGSVLGNGESDSFENIGYGILFFESDVVFNSFGVCPVTFIGALYNNADGTGVGVDSSSFTNICIQGIYDAAGFDYGSGNALKFESALVFSPIVDTKLDTYFTTSSIKAGSSAQIPILFMPQADGYEFTNVDFSVATFTSSFIPTIGIDISSSVPIFNNVYFSIDINGGGPFSIGIDFGISQVSDFIGIQCALTNVPIGTGVEFGDINFNGVTYDELYIDSTINGGIGTAVLFNGGVSTSTSSYFDITANVVPDVDSYGVYFTSDVTIYGELHILAFGSYGVFFDTELYIFTFLLDIEAYSVTLAALSAVSSG